MLKKISVTVVVATMLFSSVVPSFVFSAEQVTINNGQLLNNSVLVPLRAVSQQLGVPVEWDQEMQIVTIIKADSKIMLPANFKRAVEYSPSTDPGVSAEVKLIDLDSPVQVVQGTTYVPMRFVSKWLGADVTWNQQAKQATIQTKGKQIVVNMEQPAISPKQPLTSARLNLLSDKLNQVATVSSMKNIKAECSSYFTKRLMNTLIEGKEYPNKNQFDNPIVAVTYTSMTTATITQSFILGNDLTGSTNYVYDRISSFIYTKGVWKVDQVNFTLRSIPNLGYSE